MSNESQELRNRGNLKNHPSYDHPLVFSPIRPKHKPALVKAIWASHKQLRGYIGWAKYARSWDVKTISRFADDHINDRPPNQHFLFFIGKEIVGMGSLVSCYTPV